MKATEVLMSEHRVIERVIAVLETAAENLYEGQTVRPGFFLDATDFVKGFADGCHHAKEENVLFKTMNDYGVPAQGGPIGVMLYEHEQGRGYIRGLREAAGRLAGVMSPPAQRLSRTRAVMPCFCASTSRRKTTSSSQWPIR